MKIHVTGMSPRMVSSRARAKISFSSLLADVLTANEHEVVRDAEYHEDADLVVVGVSSVLSPAATYAIVALGIMSRALKSGTPLLLFVDDPDLGKVRDAAVSVRRDPDRMWSNFLLPKRVLASSDYSREEVMEAVDVLGQQSWPTVLVPMHAWGRQNGLNQALRIISPAVAIDISSVLLAELDGLHWTRTNDAEMWMCEQQYAKGTLSPGRTHWPVIRQRTDPSWSAVDTYGSARAVFQDTVASCPGWWTPTPLFTARSGSIFATSIDDGYRIGGPYYQTVDEIEAMSTSGHHALAADQHDYIKDVSWDLTTLTSTLEDVIGQSSSFSTPVTTS